MKPKYSPIKVIRPPPEEASDSVNLLRIDFINPGTDKRSVAAINKKKDSHNNALMRLVLLAMYGRKTKNTISITDVKRKVLD